MDLACVNKVVIETNNCRKSCSGFVVTGFSKSEINKNLVDLLPVSRDYDDYKQRTHFPSGNTGSIINLYLTSQVLFSDYEWKNKLRYVRIYFDTPTFDRITKDRAAKFVDMLSAIGGTMGLLTGFSIISGVELLYFLIKGLLSFFKARKIINK